MWRAAASAQAAGTHALQPLCPVYPTSEFSRKDFFRMLLKEVETNGGHGPHANKIDTYEPK